MAPPEGTWNRLADSGHGITGFGSVSGYWRGERGSRDCWLEEETDKEETCWDGLLGRAEARKGSWP